MISRRHFLGASTAAAAGAALATPRALTGHESPRLETASHSDVLQQMPPSIARLSSWASRAHPITTEERAARVDQAKRLMRENGMSAMALTGGTSIEQNEANFGGGERPSPASDPVLTIQLLFT